MQANWSLILNVVLLVGVVFAIAHVLRMRKKAAITVVRSPSIGQIDTQQSHYDDIIAVRKVQDEPVVVKPFAPSHASSDQFAPTLTPEPVSVVLKSSVSVVQPVTFSPEVIEEQAEYPATETPSAPLMMFLLAKEDRQLAGYELLQAVLAAGLRFGEGNLFHRHQHSNGQGTVMCSLAAATDKGVFDLQNIGAFTVRGLCLYMHASGNPGIDEERFDMMLDTAKTLSDDLDTHLLDDQRRPLSDASIQRYHRELNLVEEVI
ncbi:MAG: cell division protein ZipA C-terminal FtsZ-binding domain-containing protein [Legionellaceae bacterium]|nr:cell division protein ZipA C-terminal FtsZ-binding domain-containing protein [Legionellaceae bacterium]